MSMQSLKEAILRLEPKIDLLHDCLGFGRYAEITITSDGHFLGRAWGDIGFNDFLGAPSQAAIERTQLLFVRLSPHHQDELIRELMARRIAPDLPGLLFLLWPNCGFACSGCVRDFTCMISVEMVRGDWMRAVVDTNQALRLPSRSTEGDLSQAPSEIALAPYVLAEVLHRGNPEPTLARLREFDVRYGLEPIEVLETVAKSTEAEIVTFEPFAVPGSRSYEALKAALDEPSTCHVEWAREVKSRNRKFCRTMFDRAQLFRQKLRNRGIQKETKFDDMSEVLTNLPSFPSMVVDWISNRSKRTPAVSNPSVLYAAVMRNQYLCRFFKMILYYLISVSRAWRDQALNFDPSNKYDDWTDMTLPLYAADGDIIVTGDRKLRNAIKMIEPLGTILAKSVDEL